MSRASAGAVATTSPHGVPVTPLFFGAAPGVRDWKDASKIKTLDVHPAFPWVATADESGRVTVWDYSTEAIVFSLLAESLKDSQRSAVEALELHGAFAESLGVAVPDAAGPGLGHGVGVEPGAAAGGATEAFITERVGAQGGGGGGEGGGGGKRAPALLGALPEDARGAKTGAVRAVRFADEHVLAVACGGCPRATPSGEALGVGAGGLASTLDDLEARLRPAAGGGSLPQPSWLIILCEHRCFLLDYVTRAVIDVSHSALLLEAGGSEGGGGGGGKGKPGAHAAALVGPGVVAFGCEDGAVRLWAADANAVVHVARPPGGGGGGGGGRPVVSLAVLSTLCRDRGDGSGGAPLSPGCPLGAAAAAAHTLLLAGAADGAVTTWEVRRGGRVLGDYGRPVRAGGSELCGGVDVCSATQAALALGGDRSVTVWEASAGGGGARGGLGWGGGAQTRASAARVVSSSPAAEGGAGSRLSAAALLGGHPAFPPGALLVAGKGPHLEVALPGGAVPKGTAPPGCRADEGVIIYDLRAARPGLPAKLKVYALARHPMRADVFAVGTNIGVFVVGVASGAAAAGAAGAVASHAEWALPPTPLPAGTPGEAPRVREGVAVLHVAASGALVATEVGYASSRVAGEGVGGAPPPHAAASTPPSLTQTESVLLPSLAPHLPPPATTVPTSTVPGAPPPPHNAWAHIAALLRGNPLLPPGSRGVRLRLSGSGRYLAAVWPEHRCFAVYKVSRPSYDSAGAVQGWGCELLANGAGVDLAWSHPAAAFAVGGAVRAAPPAGAGAGAARAAPGAHPQPPPPASAGCRWERFAVLVPGAAATGRGPIGGGQAIGGGEGGGRGSKARSGAETAVRTVYAPASLSVFAVQLLEDAHCAVPPPSLVAADVALPGGGEPLALWSGPLLAAAVAAAGGGGAAAEGGASAGGAALAAALAAASLQFFGWDVLDFEGSGGEGAAGAGAPAAPESRYSGATAKARAARFRLAPAAPSAAGGGAAVPAPALCGVASGRGVDWAPCGTRLAVCAPHGLHVFAFLSARALAVYGGGAAAAHAPAAALVVELARAPGLVPTALAWLGAALLCVSGGGGGAGEEGGGGPSLRLFCPPLLDPTPYVACGLGGTPAPPHPLAPAGFPLQPVGVELATSGAPPAALPAGVSPHPFPPPRRGLLAPWAAVPVGAVRGAALLMHWVGGRSGMAGGGGGAGGWVATAAPLAAPALRAVLAASGAAAFPDPSQGPGAALVEAVGAAARAGAAAPAPAQPALAAALAAMGAPAAALTLPALPLALGVGIALGARGAVAAGLGGGGGGGGAPTRLAALDAATAVAFLRHSLKGAAPGALRALAGACDGASGAEARAGVLGPVPSAAALLALFAAAAEGGEGERAAVWRELRALAAKLKKAGMDTDAALVEGMVME